MNKFQLFIKTDFGDLEHRDILLREKIYMYPKTSTDGLSIFIKTTKEKTICLKDKYYWVLFIQKCNEPIKIIKTSIKIKKSFIATK